MSGFAANHKPPKTPLLAPSGGITYTTLMFTILRSCGIIPSAIDAMSGDYDSRENIDTILTPSPYIVPKLIGLTHDDKVDG